MKKAGMALYPALAAGLLCICAGCGSGGYEARLRARVEKLRIEKPFDDSLHDPSEAAGAGVYIRVPKVFKNAWVEGSADGSVAIDADRVKPQLLDGFLDFPDLKVTYESLEPMGSANVAYYCYVGVWEPDKSAAASESDKMAAAEKHSGDKIRAQLQDKAKWTELTCPTSDGRTSKWQYLHSSGPMRFYTISGSGKDKKETYQKLTGDIDVYMRDDSGRLITIIFRAPQDVAKKLELAKLAELMLGGSGVAGEGLASRKARSSPPKAPAPVEVAQKPNPSEEAKQSKNADPEDAKKQYSLSSDRLKQIGEALQKYVKKENRFPPLVMTEKSKPTLSWRVALLPYLGKESEALYKEFHLNEPWDSEHNLKIAQRMPDVYKTPGGPDAPKTCYLALAGDDTIMQRNNESLAPKEVVHGTGNTLCLVEADADLAAVWTSPDNYLIDPKNPFAGLGKLRTDKFLGVTGEGMPRAIAAKTNPLALLDIYTATAGEKTDWDAFEKGVAKAPEPPVDFLAEANAALAEGEERYAVQCLMADGIVRTKDEVLGMMRWSPALRRPIFAVRWAIVVEYAAGDSVAKSSSKGKSEEERPDPETLVEFWRENSIDPLIRELRTDVNEGRFGVWLKDSKQSGGEKNSARWPGIASFYATNAEEGRKAALEEGLDLALWFQVKPGIINPKVSTMTMTIKELSGNKELWASDPKVFRSSIGDVNIKVANAVNQALLYIEKSVYLTDMPKVNRDQVLKRVENLIGPSSPLATAGKAQADQAKTAGAAKTQKTSAASNALATESGDAAIGPLAALAELRYYRWMNLLNDDDLAGFFTSIAGEKDARTLLAGNEARRANVIKSRWMPVKSAKKTKPEK
jgi:hypothetical protein